MRSLLLEPDGDFAPTPELDDEIFAALVGGSVTELARVKQEYARANSGAEPPLAPIQAMLSNDLELATLFNTMGGGDEFIYETCRRVVLSSAHSVEVIRYRQAILADCLRNPAVTQRLYDLTLDALRNIRRAGASYTGAGPAYVLTRTVMLLRQHIASLRQLRNLAVAHAAVFRSAGLNRFVATLAGELGEDYLAQLQSMLDDLEFHGGIVATAGLGGEDATAEFTVHRPPPRTVQGWAERLMGTPRRVVSSTISFEIDQSDEDSTQELQWLRGKALAKINDVVVQSALHIQHFLATLRLELAFYLGALNLHRDLIAKMSPLCFPEPVDTRALALSVQDLREACLILRTHRQIVGNDISADGKGLIVITGANEGGKSTALRSLGVAQLMMQSGLFVPARRFRASLCGGVFTHYRRQEDESLDSGKLEEELGRMREIASVIGRDSLLLCNESFAATNEREGSEIARQVVSAMLAKNIRVIFVTHLYEFAHHFHSQLPELNALFLRPEREDDGRRTFRLLEGEPLSTSYGEDSFRRIFAPEPARPTRR